MKHPAGVEINLVLNAALEQEPNILMDVQEKHAGYTHVALSVRDIGEAQALVEAAGLQITGGPNNYPGGAAGMFIRDPDGNVVELYRPAQ